MNQIRETSFLGHYLGKSNKKRKTVYLDHRSSHPTFPEICGQSWQYNKSKLDVRKPQPRSWGVIDFTAKWRVAARDQLQQRLSGHHARTFPHIRPSKNRAGPWTTSLYVLCGVWESGPASSITISYVAGTIHPYVSVTIGICAISGQGDQTGGSFTFC